jgi:alkylation response protein AidB-like acyl-CoA dehydrogenase
MFDLHLTAEQLEIRETVRDFAQREMRPVALRPDRLEPFDKPLLIDVLGKASQMGLRTLALSEEAGGTGADNLTSCVVLEELAAGEVDIAAVLAQTSLLAHILFDELMTPAQRARFLPQFVEDHGYHLAFAGRDPEVGLAACYHRSRAAESQVQPTAVKQSNGDWVIDGVISFVPNAPIAKLFAVQVRTKSDALNTLLVSSDTPGLTVHEPGKVTGRSGSGDAPVIRWHHGAGAEVVFKNCRVPAHNLLGTEGHCPLASGAYWKRSAAQSAAVNLGIGKAAYEAAIDYAKLRRQGGRNIIEHQAIGTLLAEIAIKLEVARNMIWKAAWALDHPDAIADRAVSDLPLHHFARIFTSEMMREVTQSAAECFGAMGVMRDMPLQKYVNDALVFLHTGMSATAAKLLIAEALAGYERPMSV